MEEDGKYIQITSSNVSSLCINLFFVHCCVTKSLRALQPVAYSRVYNHGIEQLRYDLSITFGVN